MIQDNILWDSILYNTINKLIVAWMDGVKAFIANFDKIHTTSGLLSAMHCFSELDRSLGGRKLLIASWKEQPCIVNVLEIGVAGDDDNSSDTGSNKMLQD